MSTCTNKNANVERFSQHSTENINKHGKYLVNVNQFFYIISKQFLESIFSYKFLLFYITNDAKIKVNWGTFLIKVLQMLKLLP